MARITLAAAVRESVNAALAAAARAAESGPMPPAVAAAKVRPVPGPQPRSPAAASGAPPEEAATIEERLIPLGAIRVLSEPGLAGPARGGEQPPPTKALVDLGGEQCRVSNRFWKSIFSRYRFGASTFRYFHPEEVFQRICAVSSHDTLRVMVERRPQGPPVALAVSSPRERLVTASEVKDLAASHGAGRVVYAGGVVDCTFTPRSGEQALAIGPDAFANRFTLAVPIDGFGNACIHVALLRLVCTNGLVAQHKAFASEVPASENPRHTLRRAIECFDHGDGYAAIRERFLSAQTSWASVREAHGLAKGLLRMTGVDPGAKMRALEGFQRLTGRIDEFYGLTNVDTLPVRRQRLLPVPCRVYDLLNFAGEVATHVAREEDSRALQSWIGVTLAEEFDLEGTAEQTPEFADLFLRGGVSAAATPGHDGHGAAR